MINSSPSSRKELVGALKDREKARVKRFREEVRLQLACAQQTHEETGLKRVREESKRCMVMRGLMVALSFMCGYAEPWAR